MVKIAGSAIVLPPNTCHARCICRDSGWQIPFDDV
jgi:hypothetical protein